MPRAVRAEHPTPASTSRGNAQKEKTINPFVTLKLPPAFVQKPSNVEKD